MTLRTKKKNNNHGFLIKIMQNIDVYEFFLVCAVLSNRQGVLYTVQS